MHEEERISPAVVIAGALGLALAGVLGLTALAWAVPPKVYTCPYCGAEFATEEELLAHIELEHPEMPLLGGEILDAKWRETGSEEWHSFPLSVPAYTDVDIKWRVRNNSDSRVTFTIGAVSLGRYWLYPETLITLDPGEEADLIREGFAGEKAGTSGTMTFYLAALAGEVTSTYEPDWYDADLVDSITIQYNWY